MASQYHTIILVPNTRAKFRKFRVTKRQLRVGIATCLALTLGATWIIWSLLHGTVDATQVADLQSENEQLRTVNRTFEEDIRQLQDQIALYEERTRRLAIVAGVESLDGVGETGLGGNADPALALETMTLQMAGLDGALDAVETRLEEQLTWISSVPAVTPTKGLFASGYGYRRDPLTGRRAFHQGLDISAPAGKPVQATADGVVTRSGWNGNLGRSVYLSHGFGLQTRYGHLSKLAVEPGQRIKRGEVIGYVGSTGRSTGYHLHYEVRVDGEPVNPLAYILDTAR